MGWNPFATVSDYSSMLNKVASVTFFVSTAMIGLLYWQVPAVSAVLPTWRVSIPGTDVEIPLVVLVGALMVAGVSRMIKLHDRLSDVFYIRRRFDVYCILMPMAAASGAALSLDQQEKVREQREALMTKLFYRYASSSSEKSVVERHAITMALDQWSWYWILVEASTLLFATGIALAFSGKSLLAVVLLVLVLLITWLLQAVRSLCEQYARDEVRQILDDENRRSLIESEFRAL